MGSLFDGIGGFPLAAQRCGIRPMWVSEIEPFPVDVTKLRLPGMIHVGDITKLNGADLPPVDVITGGSPCQDLSVAGARAGLAGSRSGLFMEQTRIVKEMRHADLQRGRSDVLVRPRFMVWENVPGAFSSMCWYSFHTLGSPHLMKNWKPSCPGHPISSKTIKFQIQMHTQSAISTNERQASNTRPAVLGATGRLLSAYMSISFMPVGLRKAALSNSPVDCCNQPGFPQKSESNRGLRIDALFILRYFPEKFVFKLK